MIEIQKRTYSRPTLYFVIVNGKKVDAYLSLSKATALVKKLIKAKKEEVA